MVLKRVKTETMNIVFSFIKELQDGLVRISKTMKIHDIDNNVKLYKLDNGIKGEDR